MTSATIKARIKGHVLIRDGKTGEILLDKDNAVHNQNMTTAIARGLSHSDYSMSTGNHQIYALVLGNGGSTVDNLNQVTYLPPNIIGTSARLYNQTYFEVIDSGAQSSNSVTYQTNGSNSIVIATMTIAAAEPAGQDLTDSSPDPSSPYAFDELALMTYGTSGSFSLTTAPADSLLLTHIIFSPILKTANRELVITYSLNVSLS